MENIEVRKVVRRDWPDAHQVWFKVGVQSFKVGPTQETKEEAEWFGEMFQKGLNAWAKQEVERGIERAAAAEEETVTQLSGIARHLCAVATNLFTHTKTLLAAANHKVGCGFGPCTCGKAVQHSDAQIETNKYLRKIGQTKEDICRLPANIALRLKG